MSDNPDTITRKTATAQKDFIVTMVRTTGAILFLGGLAVALDLGGLGTMLMGSDTFSMRLIGAVIAVIGLVDAFAMPFILAKILSAPPQGQQK